MSRSDILKRLEALTLVKYLFDKPIVFMDNDPIIILTLKHLLIPYCEECNIDREGLRKAFISCLGEQQARRVIILTGLDVTVVDGNEVHTNK